MKTRWVVYRNLPRTDRCVNIERFRDEVDARTYCDIRNRNLPERVYFVSEA